MVLTAKGFELARSNGAFETWLERVSPQVVPRPGRSSSFSMARRELRDSALARGASFAAPLFLSAAGAPPPTGAEAGAGAVSVGLALEASALEPSSLGAWAASF